MVDASSNPVDAYAEAVVRGELPAGKYHRLACVRHLNDRAREGTAGFPYRFDFERAERFIRFAEKLKHYKGQWAGQFIRLQPYQQFRLGSLFGWVQTGTGLRRFRTSYSEIPRKNGKTLEAAIVLLYLTFFDGEAGAEGYTIAVKRDQAKLVFNDAKRLVTSSGLKSRIRVLTANLHREATASKAEPLGADHDSTDGLNPHVYVVDEMHAYKDRGLIDVMETATGARLQPVGFQITTAGDNPMSPCGDQHDYACKILDGVLQDETFFAFIAHADPEDEWSDEATWRKANPNYAVSVQPDDMRALATKAIAMPAAAAAFKQKRLNLWVNASAPWLSVEGWRNGQSTWSPDTLLGEPCWVGVDLSSKIDLTSVVLLFPPEGSRKRWRVIHRSFSPADTLLERERRDRAPYGEWVKRGYLQTTPGNRIDQEAIRAYINAQAERYDVQEIGFDPWNAGNLMQSLTEDGFQVVEVPQTIAHMSAPSKEFEADVLDGLVDAGGDPCLGWMATNVVVTRDGKDNIYPVKKKSRGRIDGIVATIIARRLAAKPDDTAESAYNDGHELVVL